MVGPGGRKVVGRHPVNVHLKEPRSRVAALTDLHLVLGDLDVGSHVLEAIGFPVLDGELESCIGAASSADPAVQVTADPYSLVIVPADAAPPVPPTEPPSSALVEQRVHKRTVDVAVCSGPDLAPTPACA